ncbi:MAG TPA: penicillin-binding protein 1A [Nevskiaceae bacterium]|nr:penicillin-binding protein 1A [Nevskiaceae bacterium]
MDSIPDNSPLKRWLRVTAVLAGAALAFVLVALLAVRLIIVPQLPDVQSIRDLQLQVPLRIFTSDGKMIGEFGAERRAPLKYAELPQPLIHAFLDAEDERFFEHPGVDWQGLLRAALKLASTGEKAQGGSTITMQLARNVFLSSEKTYGRKLREILLAMRIEHELTKEQILETYLNKIFLGNRAYGVGAAAQIYFGKDVHELSLAQIATLAGLPKAPSRDNPAANPQRAKDRRNYVLRRMRELDHITQAEYDTALHEPIVVARASAAGVETEAYYVAEMVRADMVARYGEAAYTDGYTVTTTIDAQKQIAANAAVRRGVVAYEERHGWNGAEAHLSEGAIAELGAKEPEQLFSELDDRPPLSSLPAAAVVEWSPKLVRVRARDLGVIEISGDGLAWANIGEKNKLKPGDVVRVWRDAKGWRLAQIPQVQSALVAVDPHDGAVRALVGGFDFFAGNYNRVLQGRRNVGSGFKPFLYSAALAFGYTPASIFLDAPVVYNDPGLGSAWRPENDDRAFRGPMRLREALVHSINLVSVRVLQAIGLGYATDFVAKFGFPRDRLPHDLTMALGSASLTPIEVAKAYAVFANGGFQVEPYFIDEIKRASGEQLFKAQPAVACLECESPAPAAIPPTPPTSAATAPPTTAPAENPPTPPPAPVGPDGAPLAPRVVDARIIYLIDSMMHDVTVRGTAHDLNAMGRGDLAGKTGTTNDETDAWFNGFTPKLVAIVWAGYDQPQSLGHGEYGARVSVPIWMDFMKVALKDVPETRLPRPPGLVNVRINPETGLLAHPGENAVDEIVQADHIPESGKTPAPGEQEQQPPPEEIF